MDKVIIDGIDVSGCEHFGIDNMELCKINFDNNYFSNGIPCAEKCSNHSDCYYKQLKRKELECERLKWLLETKCQSEWEKENAELKAECEELKADIQSRTMCITCERELQNCNLQAENERLKSIVESNNQQVEQAELLVMDNDRLQQEVENLKDTIYYDVEKYRQTLQEIRDIAKEIQQDKMADAYFQKSLIIAKINEVIGAEE